METKNNLSLEEFKRNIKYNSVHKFKITNSFFIWDAVKYYTKNRPKDSKYVVRKDVYCKIIRRVNDYLAEEFLSTGTLDLPYSMGKIYTRKVKPTVKIVNDELVNTRSIDWDKTLKLWYEDKECYDAKIKLRFDLDRVKIIYSPGKRTYTNRKYFIFKAHIKLKKNISLKVNNGLINTFKYGKILQHKNNIR